MQLNTKKQSPKEGQRKKIEDQIPKKKRGIKYYLKFLRSELLKLWEVVRNSGEVVRARARLSELGRGCQSSAEVDRTEGRSPGLEGMQGRSGKTGETRQSAVEEGRKARRHTRAVVNAWRKQRKVSEEIERRKRRLLVAVGARRSRGELSAETRESSCPNFRPHFFLYNPISSSQL